MRGGGGGNCAAQSKHAALHIFVTRVVTSRAPDVYLDRGVDNVLVILNTGTMVREIGVDFLHKLAAHIRRASRVFLLNHSSGREVEIIFYLSSVQVPFGHYF